MKKRSQSLQNAQVYFTDLPKEIEGICFMVDQREFVMINKCLHNIDIVRVATELLRKIGEDQPFVVMESKSMKYRIS